MSKEFLIQLTNNLYRLTLLFPKKEPLRYKMREIADDILANSLRIMNQSESPNKKTEVKCLTPGVKQSWVLEELEVLDGFFEVAKNQNWVSPQDLLKLQQEYNKLKEELKREEKSKSQEIYKSQTPVKILTDRGPTSATERQQKILEFLREKGRVQVWQMKEIFPEISKRTLRRDFNNLLKKGIIKRVGERNETFYHLKTLL